MFFDPKSQQYDKSNKRERGQWLLAQADALKDPDEIWVRMEWHEAQKKWFLVRRYLKRFYIDDEPVPSLSVFEIISGEWEGTTTFKSEDTAYLENQRQGVLLYRRK